MRKKVGRNASAQRNHLHIRANFTFLTAEKPKEHAQTQGYGVPKMCYDRGGLSASLTFCLAAPHSRTGVLSHQAYRNADCLKPLWWRSRAGDAAVPMCMCPCVSHGGLGLV